MMRFSRTLPWLAVLLTSLGGCNSQDAPRSSSKTYLPEPCAVALVPHAGGERIDLGISRLAERSETGNQLYPRPRATRLAVRGQGAPEQGFGLL